ncbi:MAG: RluA family pseudouridine synthase [Magnetococcales bacterium]|nr:RluA family pseudouridine synthase [Magnetococcales bacterium]
MSNNESDILLSQERLTVRLTPEQATYRLDKALSLACPLMSRANIQRLLKSGQVLKAGAIITNSSEKSQEGVNYSLCIPTPEPTHAVPESVPLEILHEDSDLIVVNKAAGMVVHPGAGVNRGTLVNALLGHCGEELSGIGGEVRPGIVHRLDKDTSGILVVAKNDFTHQGLAKQFEQHTATRQYTAITSGVPKPTKGQVDAPIGRHPNQRTKMAVNLKGRQAITHYQVHRVVAPFALIACRLETGRTHQIRVHMAHLGTPLFGDPVYGRPVHPDKHWPEAVRNTLTDFRRQALHATTLGFIHPRSQLPLNFQSDPPDDFKALWQAIQKLCP